MQGLLTRNQDIRTDHLVFSPKYRGNVPEGEVAEAAENIRETCKDRDIEVIDMAVNVDHV